MIAGRVKFFDAVKGFGFAAGDDGTDYFVGDRTLQATGITDLGEGDRIEFEPEPQRNGKMRATSIRIVERAARTTTTRTGGWR